MSRLFFSHVLFPLLIGFFIYLFFREDSLLFFNWAEKINLYNILIKIKSILNPNNLVFHNWMTQILPDALWCYSYSSFFIIVLNKQINIKNFWLFSIPFFVAVGFEFFQYFSILKGTFDLYDIFAYLLSVILSLFLLTKKSKKNEISTEN